MKTAGICTKIRGVTSSKIAIAAMAICAAGLARAATYYWGNSGTTDGDLANLSNWTTGSNAASENPTVFSADDTYTVRHASTLPTGVANWFLTGDADMLGVLSSTKNASSAAAPHEFLVNLNGFSLNVKNLACRGVMTFTNGVFTATGAASTVGYSTASDPAGILTFGEGATATLKGITYDFTSGNSVNVVDGGTLTISTALNIGHAKNSIDNRLVVRGAGSKFTSSATVRVAGVDSGTEPTTSGNSVIVSDGGVMEISGTGALVIGGLNNSTGNSVTIEGTGSSLTVAGTTYVGGNGKTGCEGNLYVLDGATFGGVDIVIGMKSDNQEMVVSNATVQSTGALRFGGTANNYGGEGALLHVAGAAPSVTVGGAGIYVYAPSKMRFDIPAEGWNSAPVKVTGSGKTINFSSTAADASLELVVKAKGVPEGRYVLVATNGSIDFTKVSLSADCTGMVELDKSNSNEIAVNVKKPGLAIFVR